MLRKYCRILWIKYSALESSDLLAFSKNKQSVPLPVFAFATHSNLKQI